MRRGRLVVSVLAGLGLALGGCASRVIHGEDGSVSFGPSNDGALLAPAELPPVGPGYRMPPTWAQRGLRYGTDELVAMIQHLGAVIDEVEPGRAVAVADLSRPRGGPSAWHRSHQTGRDVDLVFFARDEAGRPVDPATIDAMRRFGADGRTLPELGPDGAPRPTLVFDDAANWALVRALITNPIAEVQYAFVSDDLRQRLLDHAEAEGEDADVIAAAMALLRQPGDSLPHDDHFHVRVFCSARDRDLGCSDAGQLGWRKKDWKYDRRPGGAPATSVASTAADAPGAGAAVSAPRALAQ